MTNEVLTLGPLTIQKGPEENFESYTSSRAKSVGKLTQFHVGGEGVSLLIGYSKFINGERDIRTTNIYKEFETFERLKHGLRLSLLPTSDDARMLYAELRQAFPKDNFSKHQTLLRRDSFILDDILPMAQVNGSQNETLLKMGIQVALQGLPEQFENIGIAARPQWRALPPSRKKQK
ncbi:MAG TPA: hypothetical protein PLV64_24110 [Anaerolineales bacterium]|nr:hypothetical protein [Anaerolineales bacterium]